MILDQHRDLRESLHELYVHLHRHPELSMQEHGTEAAYRVLMARLGTG